MGDDGPHRVVLGEAVVSRGGFLSDSHPSFSVLGLVSTLSIMEPSLTFYLHVPCVPCRGLCTNTAYDLK